MKKIYLLLMLVSIITSLSAEIIRVNSGENTMADYDNLPDALSASSNGDTLFLEGYDDGYYTHLYGGHPLYSYSNINNSHNIRGSGYFNVEYSQQHQSKNTLLYAPHLNEQNITVKSMKFYTGYHPSHNVSDITISANNIFLENIYMTSQSANRVFFISANASNVIVSKCYNNDLNLKCYGDNISINNSRIYSFYNYNPGNVYCF